MALFASYFHTDTIAARRPQSMPFLAKCRIWGRINASRNGIRRDKRMQTLTVREAGTQLQALVKQAQATHEPVILTNDIDTPVALLTPFVVEKPNQDAILLRRLEILASVTQMWQQHHADPSVSQEAAQLFQSQLRQLGAIDRERSSPAFGALVMLLRLAARTVMTPTPARQLQALALGVDMLNNPALSWQHIETVDQQLIASGIDARADFGDDELLKSYVNAS